MAGIRGCPERALQVTCVEPEMAMAAPEFLTVLSAIMQMPAHVLPQSG